MTFKLKKDGVWLSGLALGLTIFLTAFVVMLKFILPPVHNSASITEMVGAFGLVYVTVAAALFISKYNYSRGFLKITDEEIEVHLLLYSRKVNISEIGYVASGAIKNSKIFKWYHWRWRGCIRLYDKYGRMLCIFSHGPFEDSDKILEFFSTRFKIR
jgi:hypothetical protein